MGRSASPSTSKEWDSSTLRQVPPSLRGMRPTTSEPWTGDAISYHNEEREKHSFTRPEAFNDRLDKRGSFNRAKSPARSTSKGAKTAVVVAGRGVIQQWNSSTYRVVPPGLRGIKPIVSNEPWMGDRLIYSEATTTNKDQLEKTPDRTSGPGLDLGSQASRSWGGDNKEATLKRTGDRMANFEKWGSTLS